MKKLKVLSLFTGIGAFEKALKNIGIDYDLVGFSELDKYAVESYCLIHKEPKEKNLGDINKINPAEIKEFDLMTYGFPCLSFSVQGKKLGFKDKKNGNLFFESMRIVAEKKPKYLIAENVAGLMTNDNSRTIDTIFKTLEGLGYNNYWKLLNATDFGVPHRRYRVFIVSIRKDIDNGCFKFPVGTKTKLTVEDILDKNNRHRHLKDSLKPYLDPKYHREYTSVDGVIKVFDGNIQGYFNTDYSGKRIYSIKGVCPTLTTKTDQANFYEIASGLNSLERFRLQGFSDEDHRAVNGMVSEARLKKQTGNSIAVPVLEAIFKNLLGEYISE